MPVFIGLPHLAPLKIKTFLSSDFGLGVSPGLVGRSRSWQDLAGIADLPSSLTNGSWPSPQCHSNRTSYRRCPSEQEAGDDEKHEAPEISIFRLMAWISRHLPLRQGIERLTHLA